MDRVARLALAPLLLAQALHTRKTALTLPEPDGPRAGHAGDGPALRLLILGDSSAAGVGVDHQDNALSGHLTRALSATFSVHWQLLARTGATTRDAHAMLKDATPMDVALVALGVNDVTGLTTPRHFANRQLRLVEALESRGARLICLTEIPPVGTFPLLPNPLRWTLGRHARRLQQARATRLANRPTCVGLTLDLPADPTLMARDGFHPGAQVYRVWGETAAALIRAHSRFFLA